MKLETTPSSETGTFTVTGEVPPFSISLVLPMGGDAMWTGDAGMHYLAPIDNGDGTYSFNVPAPPTFTVTYWRDNEGDWERVDQTMDRVTQKRIGDPVVTVLGKTADLRY